MLGFETQISYLVTWARDLITLCFSFLIYQPQGPLQGLGEPLLHPMRLRTQMLCQARGPSSRCYTFLIHRWDDRPVPPDRLHRLQSSSPRSQGTVLCSPFLPPPPPLPSFPLSLPGRRSGGYGLRSRGVLSTKVVMSLQSQSWGDKATSSLRAFISLHIFPPHLA